MKTRTGVMTLLGAALFLLVQATAANAAGDAAAGEKLFKAKCALCHSNQAGVNRVGPSSFGTIGRVVGTVPGYNYSEALKTMSKKGQKWDAAMLDGWLTNPKAVASGTKMAFVGLSAKKDRDDVIAYLAKLK
ncbi:MAG: c-type cytochrome [Candidatus Pacebacteria bacterium]|nr:c-type cytochrome [Candidatus Paceibacterota bacterium]